VGGGESVGACVCPNNAAMVGCGENVVDDGDVDSVAVGEGDGTGVV